MLSSKTHPRGPPLARRCRPAPAAARSASDTYSATEKPPTLRISGHGRASRRGSSSATKASRPSPGRPMALIIPPGVSSMRGGGLPARGDSVIVLGTYAATGGSARTARSTASARSNSSIVPEALMSGCASRSGPSCTERSTTEDLLPREHGSFVAHPRIGPVGQSYHATVTRSHSAGHVRLEAEPGLDLREPRAHPPDRLGHGLWAADRHPVSRPQMPRQQVGDPLCRRRVDPSSTTRS